ncbi:MAG: hypothetical protein U0840_15100 [Gemmataceae bacterium]
MRTPTPTSWTLGLIALTAGLLLAQAPELPPPFERSALPGDPPPVPGAEQRDRAGPAEPEVLGRGPLHEAFAQPPEQRPRAPFVVPRKPPEPVAETPPEEKPEGDNLAWIPGYWSWDDEREDFIWISGIWRIPPPGRKWVPGYWNQTNEGWQWVPGLWANDGQPTMPYLGTPPESLDIGPNQPAPADNYSWVPGIWLGQDERWLWRPGFWCPPRDGWVYTPARYQWSPGGLLYVGGFWDRCMLTRGVPFAPVYFGGGGFWRVPGYSFRPSVCLGMGATMNALWARPGWGYYAFGDFYGARFAARGFQPWHLYGPRARDTLFAYHGNAFAGGRGAWANRLAATYDGRRTGTLPLPPSTLAAQERAGAATPRVLQSLASYRNTALPLTRVSPAEQTVNTRYASAVRQAGMERARTEGPRPGIPGGTRALALSAIPSITPQREPGQPLSLDTGKPQTDPGRASFYSGSSGAVMPPARPGARLVESPASGPLRSEARRPAITQSSPINPLSSTNSTIKPGRQMLPTESGLGNPGGRVPLTLPNPRTIPMPTPSAPRMTAPSLPRMPSATQQPRNAPAPWGGAIPFSGRGDSMAPRRR